MGSKKKGYFAQRKHAKKVARRREAWERTGANVQAVSAGVGIITTLITGIVAVVNATSGATPRELDRTDQLISLAMDARKAEKASHSYSHRRQARQTRKAADKALEALAARRSTAEAEYAAAVHEGMQMHRIIPAQLPVWWPEGVSNA